MTAHIEVVEQREYSSIAGASANQYNHFGNQFGKFLEMEIYLPQDPDIPLLDIYPKNASPFAHI